MDDRCPPNQSLESARLPPTGAQMTAAHADQDLAGDLIERRNAEDEAGDRHAAATRPDRFEAIEE